MGGGGPGMGGMGGKAGGGMPSGMGMPGGGMGGPGGGMGGPGGGRGGPGGGMGGGGQGGGIGSPMGGMGSGIRTPMAPMSQAGVGMPMSGGQRAAMQGGMGAMSGPQMAMAQAGGQGGPARGGTTPSAPQMLAQSRLASLGGGMGGMPGLPPQPPTQQPGLGRAMSTGGAMPPSLSSGMGSQGPAATSIPSLSDLSPLGGDKVAPGGGSEGRDPGTMKDIDPGATMGAEARNRAGRSRGMQRGRGQTKSDRPWRGGRETFYAPGASSNRSGGEGELSAAFTGQPNRTVNDFLGGRSPYASGAGDRSRAGEWGTSRDTIVPQQGPLRPGEQRPTTNVGDVPVRIEDTGRDFRGKPNRTDIAGTAPGPIGNKAAAQALQGYSGTYSPGGTPIAGAPPLLPQYGGPQTATAAPMRPTPPPASPAGAAPPPVPQGVPSQGGGAIPPQQRQPLPYQTAPQRFQPPGGQALPNRYAAPGFLGQQRPMGGPQAPPMAQRAQPGPAGAPPGALPGGQQINPMPPGTYAGPMQGQGVPYQQGMVGAQPVTAGAGAPNAMPPTQMPQGMPQAPQQAPPGLDQRIQQQGQRALQENFPGSPQGQQMMRQLQTPPQGSMPQQAQRQMQPIPPSRQPMTPGPGTAARPAPMPSQSRLAPLPPTQGGGQLMSAKDMAAQLRQQNPAAGHEATLQHLNQNRQRLDPQSQRQLDQINHAYQRERFGLPPTGQQGPNRDFYPGGPNTGQNPNIGPMYQAPVGPSERQAAGVSSRAATPRTAGGSTSKARSGPAPRQTQSRSGGSRQQKNPFAAGLKRAASALGRGRTPRLRVRKMRPIKRFHARGAR